MKKTNHIVPGQIGPECMDSQHLVPELEKPVKFHDQLRSGLINFSLNIYLFDKLHNTIRYDTIRYDTIRYDTIRYDTIRYNTIQYNTMQYRVYKTGSGKKPVGLSQIRFPDKIDQI